MNWTGKLLAREGAKQDADESTEVVDSAAAYGRKRCHRKLFHKDRL
jgi:hypothetical protein